jgi:hypothetical protein
MMTDMQFTTKIHDAESFERVFVDWHSDEPVSVGDSELPLGENPISATASVIEMMVEFMGEMLSVKSVRTKLGKGRSEAMRLVMVEFTDFLNTGIRFSSPSASANGLMDLETTWNPPSDLDFDGWTTIVGNTDRRIVKIADGMSADGLKLHLTTTADFYLGFLRYAYNCFMGFESKERLTKGRLVAIQAIKESAESTLTEWT